MREGLGHPASVHTAHLERMCLYIEERENTNLTQVCYADTSSSRSEELQVTRDGRLPRPAKLCAERSFYRIAHMVCISSTNWDL